MNSTPATTPGRPVPGQPTETAPFDPLRLCIYTTVALITWLTGPWGVLVFAGMGLAGYWRAHQAGLTRSKCYLRDVRLVLLYLFAVAAVALWFGGKQLLDWIG